MFLNSVITYISYISMYLIFRCSITQTSSRRWYL